MHESGSFFKVNESDGLPQVMPNQIYIPLGIPNQVEKQPVQQIQDEPLQDDPTREKFEPLHDKGVIQIRKIWMTLLDQGDLQEQGKWLFLMIILFTSNSLSLISGLRMIQRCFHKP